MYTSSGFRVVVRQFPSTPEYRIRLVAVKVSPAQSIFFSSEGSADDGNPKK